MDIVPEGFISLEAANANRLIIEWNKEHVYQPKEKKLIILKQIDIRDLEEYLDWNILFASFGMKGRYPKLLNDVEFGQQAKELLDEAKTALIKIKKEGFFQIDALFKVWKCYSEGNTIHLEGESIHFLRQQTAKKKSQPNYCLSDFIAPKGSVADYIGGYTVSVGTKKQCPSNKMHTALSTLLIDAGRKYLHLKIRTEYWAYAKREKLTTEDILKHKYQGTIIPVGHAALPNTESNILLNEFLNAEGNLGRPLTNESQVDQYEFGWCFSHPESKYFGTGKIGTDQLEHFAKSINTLPKDLSSHLLELRF